MKAYAVTGETGNRLFGEYDLSALRGSSLGTGSDTEKVLSANIEWESSSLGELVFGLRLGNGKMDYGYELLARHLLSLGYMRNQTKELGVFGLFQPKGRPLNTGSVERGFMIG